MKFVRKRFMFLFAAILISTMVLLPIEVAAAGTLDQQQTTINSREFVQNDANGIYNLGQTFTAGLTGCLTEVDLAIGCFTTTPGIDCSANGPVTVEIHSGSPIVGVGLGPLLGSSSLPYSAFPISGLADPSVFIAFTFPCVGVTAGSVYTMVITTTHGPYGQDGSYAVGMSAYNPYPSGTAYEDWPTKLPPIIWEVYSSGTWDYAFKTYVVEPAVGGFVEPFNTFAVLAPWLAVIGVVGCISIVVVVARKRLRS